jgi:hypothetical protein
MAKYWLQMDYIVEIPDKIVESVPHKLDGHDFSLEQVFCPDDTEDIRQSFINQLAFAQNYVPEWDALENFGGLLDEISFDPDGIDLERMDD